MQNTHLESSSEYTETLSPSTPTVNQTDSQQSVISISTASLSQTDSQNSVLSWSSEDLFINISSSESEEESTKTSEKNINSTEDFKEFCASTIRYCQGLTVITRSKNKTTSTVTDIQIFMTEGNDSRLFTNTEDAFPILILCKSNKVVAILLDKIDPGQYLLSCTGKKMKVSSETETNKEKVKGMVVKKGIISKYTGSVTNCIPKDSQILILSSFHKQPLLRKMISTKQSLSTKVAVLQADLTQSLLEQNSPVKHEQILLRIINEAAEKITILDNKRKKKSNKDQDNENVIKEEAAAEPVKKKPKFQLRIVLQEKSKTIQNPKTDVKEEGQCSLEDYLPKHSSQDHD